jgi:adenosylcobinamide-phosphate synthase
MSLISLIAALFIEQFRPLDYARWVVAPIRALADWCERTVNAGSYQHGVLGWGFLAGGATIAAAITFIVLDQFSGILALAWNVLVLYLTMGFRQFSHHYTEIHLALRMGEIDRARTLLAEWRDVPEEMWSSSEIARQSIEYALLQSHRHVFAVLFWFVLLPGPSGAVLYRVAALLADRWSGMTTDREPFGRFARLAFEVIDWLPQRVTATGFAIVGDFEDAVQCWRTQAGLWGDRTAGVVLAAGAGALGVRLGVAAQGSEDGVAGQGDCAGAEADVDFMQSAVGLVWRALVLWLLLLFMLGLASLVG